jgi:hypothetical protein
MEFSRPIPGRCVFCEKDGDVVGVPGSMVCVAGSKGLPHAHGACDLCSYALRHAWQRAQGERVVAVSPHLVRTYALVPRLRKGRSASDVSGYEFLIDHLDLDGRLPSADFLPPGGLFPWLGKQYGVVTWEETTRRCYLGYDGRADFAEVVFAWAWGRDPRAAVKSIFQDFAYLLAEPSADAGFYLGVKAAFEALLWRQEVEGDEAAPCVLVREPAMRYLGSQARRGGGRDDGEGDDSTMVEIYRSAMSPEEIKVVAFVLGAEERRREAAKAAAPDIPLEKAREEVPDAAVEDEVVVGDESGRVDDEVVSGSGGDVGGQQTVARSPATRPPESVPPGFARSPGKVRAP